MFWGRAVCTACFYNGSNSFSLVRQFCASSARQSLPKGWRSVIGLEIHAQIDSHSKLFSGSSTEFGSPPNTNVSCFDAAIPGTLPVLNKKCVELAVVTALALKCRINPVSHFDRKHYFYADLPAGYQITQFNCPYAEDGYLDFLVFTPTIHKKPYKKRSRLKQIQLEQDSGKSLHDSELQRSLIDLNRAGVGLMEFVFEPDLADGEEAAALVKELSLILLRLKSCTCKMEEGALRVDANVSISNNPKSLGVRTEIKNIGSVRGVANAINYEIKRQFDLVSRGGQVVNETRNWDAQSSTTVSMRDKEVKEDYRFMPEPNLPPLRIGVSKEESQGDLVCVNELQLRIPELPEESRAFLVEQHKLPLEHAIQLVNDDGLLSYFREITSEKSTRTGKLVSNLLLMDFSHLLNKGVVAFNDGRLTTSKIGEIVDLLQSEKINLTTARGLMESIAGGIPLTPIEIVKKEGLEQISDEETLVKLCDEVIAKNSEMVLKIKNGKTKLFPALMGQISKQTKNKANMEKVARILRDKIVHG